MNTEPDYDDLTIVRMAIVERDERLVILMPASATDDQVEQFRSRYLAYGWPENRVMILHGPEAMAVIKRSADGRD